MQRQTDAGIFEHGGSGVEDSGQARLARQDCAILRQIIEEHDGRTEHPLSAAV